MAVYNKFQDFAEQIGLEQHQLSTDTLKVALTDTAPVATQTTFDPVTNHAAPTNTNGYPAGGSDVTNTWTETGGTATAGATDVVFTASGGTIGPFRYVILYNDTNATDQLVAWWDYGSSITLQDTETFTVDFQADTLFTLA
jgi:hypothetical protein